MTASDLIDLRLEGVGEDLVEAAIYPTEQDGFDHGLVALALGHPFWLVPSAAGYRLLVERPALARIHDELAYFDREHAARPATTAALAGSAFRSELLTPMVWTVLLLATYHAQVSRPGFTAAGSLDTHAIFERGEGWRLLTALFLHADAAHLLANILGGMAVFSAVLASWGRIRGWLLLATAAIAGNFAAAALHAPSDYRSIGASTAVFAGLGLLTGQAVWTGRRASHPHRWRTWLIPLAAGLTVLGLFGAGGVQIDVIAHTTGFGAGVILGFINRPPARWHEPAVD